MTDQPQPTFDESEASPEGSDSAQHDTGGRAGMVLRGALLVLGKLAIGFAIPIVIVIVLAIIAQVVISGH